MLHAGHRVAPNRRIIGAALLVLAAVIPVAAQTASPSPTPQPMAGVHRWFDIESLSVSTRYRFIEGASGMTNANQQQWQLAGRGRFKIDKRARYSVAAAIETGNSITGGWNNLGWGTGDPQSNIFVKQLYFDAKPAASFQVQVGGIGFNNGEATEITGYDNDAFLTGERLQLRLPKKLWFDEVTLTNGYVGDLNRPNVFRRFRHIGRSNYHQVMVRKRLNSMVAFSAGYSFESGVHTLRQAVKVGLSGSKLLDTMIFENYQRIDPGPTYGFGVTGEKRVNARLRILGGFSKISDNVLNGDRFQRGTRFYFGPVYRLTRELSVNPFIIRAVGPLPSPNLNRTRFEIIASFNIIEAFRHYRTF